MDLTLEAQQRAESPFEREVIAALVARGYSVRPQYPVGAYRIDVVVEDGDRKLAVECDGERFHPPEKLQEDVKRQLILERRGWRFVRIRGSAFYRYPEQAMAPVYGRLEDLGIRPVPREHHPSLHAADGIVADVIRRAEELERGWAETRAD